MVKISIPSGAGEIISRLQHSGHEAYIVGGCVRDSILGVAPKDWDVCTSARPEEVMKIFSDKRVIETGLKHGTVTILCDDDQYEVTTYRIDGEYTDGRRPDSVMFTASLEDDLSRRDFTINAMAYNDQSGLVDPFGGMDDLKEKVIRCVGDPMARFEEDALRILRAVRFAATIGFSVETNTSGAMFNLREKLCRISSERICAELSKIVVAPFSMFALTHFHYVITTIIPEFCPCYHFAQNNIYHVFDVYQHTCVAVWMNRSGDPAVALALLLHDIGKPDCYTEDETGGHFYHHAARSRELAADILRRLRFDNKTIGDVLELIEYHDATILPTTKHIRRWLGWIGEDQLRRLIDMRKADILAQSWYKKTDRLYECDAALQVLDAVIAENQCFSLKDLAVNGHDLMGVGIPHGKHIGTILNYLLGRVVDEEIENDKVALLGEARLLYSVADKWAEA